MDRLMEIAGPLVAVIVVLFLISQRWFWVLLFFLSGLAAALSALAYTVHFQIVEGVVLVVLAMVAWWIMLMIIAGAQR